MYCVYSLRCFKHVSSQILKYLQSYIQRCIIMIIYQVKERAVLRNIRLLSYIQLVSSVKPVTSALLLVCLEELQYYVIIVLTILRTTYVFPYNTISYGDRRGYRLLLLNHIAYQSLGRGYRLITSIITQMIIHRTTDDYLSISCTLLHVLHNWQTFILWPGVEVSLTA